MAASARGQAGHGGRQALPPPDRGQRTVNADRPSEQVPSVGVDGVQEPSVTGKVLVPKPGLTLHGGPGHRVLQRQGAVLRDGVPRDGAIREVRGERVPAVLRDDGPADLGPTVSYRPGDRLDRTVTHRVRGD